MGTRNLVPVGWLLATLAAVASGQDAEKQTLQVEPTAIRLVGSVSTAQLVVSRLDHQGRPSDATDRAEYSVEDPSIVAVDSNGLVQPLKEGRTSIVVRIGAGSAKIVATVEDMADKRPVRFVGEILPILTKSGCNSGGCHGKASGQNGFKLSLLGYDPGFDHEAIAREARGRRIFPAAPERSLFLMKASGKTPHAGGRKFASGSREYQTIRRWIAQGAPYFPDQEAKLASIAVEPSLRVVGQDARQQLRVEALYDDGTSLDVTRRAVYQSNAPDLATVDEAGLVRTLDGVGEAAIMIRFGGQVAVARAVVPLKGAPDWTDPPSDRFVDRHVFAKLRELGLPPSEACDDAEFLRRASLDIRGIPPKPIEIKRFLADKNPDKRRNLIDDLLETPEYADFFALKWSAILRNKRMIFGGPNADPGTYGFHAWIRESIAENKPYDRFVAEILTARGDSTRNPPVVWYRQFNRTTENLVEDAAQLFLGQRIQCAKCHHHPFEKWSQDDYYGLTAFFSRIGRKPGNSGDPFTSLVYNLPKGLARNETTGKSYAPKTLNGASLDKLGPRDDPREKLVEWLTSPNQKMLAKALVNRYWKHFFDRGIVDPEDDLRVTNPPSNPELLEALADDFIASGYDLKHLIREIASSKTYDRSSRSNAFNIHDRRNFARYYPRRLNAEALRDAICLATGVEDDYQPLPKGYRAAQIPDDGGTAFFGGEEQGPYYFLRIFGRPKRESVCECERTADANLAQTLHLLNSPDLQAKLSANEGRASKLALDVKRTDEDKLAELYFLCLGRSPDSEERAACLAHLAKKRAENQLRQGYEDIIWSLMNTKEFLFNH